MRTNEKKDYIFQRMIHAPRESVFQLLTTVAGLNRWWGKAARGNPLEQGKIRFTLRELQETLEVHVGQLKSPGRVQWTVLKDKYQGEWLGTMILFDLVKMSANTCILHFRHIGLTPALPCYEHSKKSWEQLLCQLVMESEK